MKQCSLLVFLLVFAFPLGCQPPQYIPGRLVISGFDFTKYSDLGFLITPDDYQGDYESAGLIEVSYVPDARLETVKDVKSLSSADSLNLANDPWFVNDGGEGGERKVWRIDEIEPSRIIDTIYNECRKMGANALTQLSIEYFFENHAEGTTRPVRIPGVRVSGFAIKRLGAFK